jgi:tRNA(adenine34) deaminase
MSLTYSYDEECMRAAIEESVKAVLNGNMPFGGVIADQSGKILVRGHNMCTAGSKRGGSGDVTKHAEVEVVRAACAEIDPDLRPTCTLYASTEPCVMCAGAIYWSRIGRVVYGCSSEELADLTGPGGFDIPIYDIYGLGRAGTRILEVGGPLLSEEAMNVHRSSGVWCTTAETKESNLDLTANKDIELERSLLASGVGAAAATRDCTVPVIDMSKGSDEEVAAELWKAATTCGFFTVVGHGIPHGMIDGAFEASAQFFALDKETKEEQSPFARNLNSGYEYMTQVRPST